MTFADFDPDRILPVLANVASVHWLRPHWLWLLATLPLLALWWQARRRRQGAWRGLVDPHLLPHLLETAPGTRVRVGPWLALLGSALAICALAGPSWQRSPQPVWQSRTPLVFALDLSSATLAGDMPPSRLAQARAKIARLLHARAGGQTALVVFADDAHTVAPLTDDTANIAVFLDALAPDIMPVDGSRADRAIDGSSRLLHNGGFDRGDIVVLTDHADADARRAAAAAARAGYRVSALGLGTEAGAAYRGVDGRFDTARLQPDSLQALASAGGGRYAALQSGEGDLQSLGVLDPTGVDSTAAHGAKAGVWRDQGYWLLLPLMLLALFAFRRGGALGVLLLCAWLPWQPARAADSSWWQRPDQQAHARLLQGADAYRDGDFARAAAQWSGLRSADAAYNRGNAFAKQGDYDAAIAAYDEALRRQPEMADAIANRKAVEAARRRRPPSGGQQQSPQEQQRKDKNGPQQAQPGPRQPGDRGRGSGDRSSAPDDTGKSSPDEARAPNAQAPKRESGGSGSQSAGSTTDAATQRRADAAQRERMRQALQKQPQPGASGTGSGTRQRAETPAERERRLADEAWLRRVPDDPGGLLRARFRLEYERRQQEGGQ
ncbi:MAG: VWA domain-containing protein [Luteimonas sp.]